jgi:hypothetical protein
MIFSNPRAVDFIGMKGLYILYYILLKKMLQIFFMQNIELNVIYYETCFQFQGTYSRNIQPV